MPKFFADKPRAMKTPPEPKKVDRKWHVANGKLYQDLNDLAHESDKEKINRAVQEGRAAEMEKMKPKKSPEEMKRIWQESQKAIKKRQMEEFAKKHIKKA